MENRIENLPPEVIVLLNELIELYKLLKHNDLEHNKPLFQKAGKIAIHFEEEYNIDNNELSDLLDEYIEHNEITE